MKLKNQLTLHRLIGKIDNDFNISESDWIPRVAAWVTDALSQMKILPSEKKRRTLEVSERIAQFPCELNATELKVYDSNGNEIKELDSSKGCNCNNNFGKADNCRCNTSTPVGNTDNKEIGVFDSTNKSGVNTVLIGTVTSASGRNFVLDGNNIELNFDTDSIVVESYETATYYDEYYNCECPYIYDNGLLLEALSWYCMFKYLSRGSKHPVYDLKSNSQVTNPFIQWSLLKTKAANAVKMDISKNKNEGWANFFYNSTFRPRD